MTIQKRRARQQGDRERLIIAAARELAEAEGWDAVTSRKLAEKVEYSQPVLYSHFKSMDAIVAAVAIDGCVELTDRLRAARANSAGPGEDIAAVGIAYLAFGNDHPAVYDAIFSRTVALKFASTDTPEPLQAAFRELAEACAPHARGDDIGLLTETYWAALHGLVTLTRGGRLPAPHRDRRFAMLVDRFTH